MVQVFEIIYSLTIKTKVQLKTDVTRPGENFMYSRVVGLSIYR